MKVVDDTQQLQTAQSLVFLMTSLTRTVDDKILPYLKDPKLGIFLTMDMQD